MSGDKINSLWQTMADLHAATHFACSLLSAVLSFCMPLVKTFNKQRIVDSFEGRDKQKTQEPERVTVISINMRTVTEIPTSGRSYAFRAAVIFHGLISNFKS